MISAFVKNVFKEYFACGQERTSQNKVEGARWLILVAAGFEVVQ
jgi:hypothetical protein